MGVTLETPQYQAVAARSRFERGSAVIVLWEVWRGRLAEQGSPREAWSQHQAQPTPCRPSLRAAWPQSCRSCRTDGGRFQSSTLGSIPGGWRSAAAPKRTPEDSTSDPASPGGAQVVPGYG